MILSKLLSNIDHKLVHGKTNKIVSSLAYNSKDISKDAMFIAVEGHNDDGRNYIKDAIKNGANSIMLSKYKELDLDIDEDVTIIEVEDTRSALAKLSREYYGNPSAEMTIIGVTGTKGKTSVTFMLKEILELAGIKTGIIGTIKSGFDGSYIDSINTTPESLDIQCLFRSMLDGGCKAVVMEVSSQGIKDKRIDGISFDIGVFTNIWPDHIGEGEHKDFEEYLCYKSELFCRCEKAVLNGNHAYSKEIIKRAQIEKPITFGNDEDFDYCIKNIENSARTGEFFSSFSICEKKDCKHIEHHLSLNMATSFNIENMAAAIAVARILDISWEVIKEATRGISVPGRTEIVPSHQNYTVMIDYAHNGEALRTLLTSLKEFNPMRLILVFGSGGNRDKNRRYEMGEVAYNLADFIIVTSDNPRKEDPKQIIKDITNVMEFCDKPILVIPDRRKAIIRAMDEGRADDLIVIAGKGHEKYQIIGDKTIYFDDREVVLTYGKEQ